MWIASLATMLTRLPILISLGLSLGLIGACTTDDGPDVIDATLSVDNQSDFAIAELYLTETGNPSWGDNLLRGDVLLPDEQLTLGVDCDFYDVLLVDEDGVDCELHDLDLCLNDADFVIRNSTCSVFGAKPGEPAPTPIPTTPTTPKTN